MLETLLAVYLFIGGFIGVCSVVIGLRKAPSEWGTSDEGYVLVGLTILAVLALCVTAWPLLALGSLVGRLAAWFGKRK